MPDFRLRSRWQATRWPAPQAAREADYQSALQGSIGATLSLVFALAEALLVFAVIMAYIWELRVTYPYFWLLAVALIVASHLARHELPEDLGFRARNFGDCLWKFGPVLIGLFLAIWGTGMLLGSIRPLGFGPAMQSLAVYLPWGLFQQYLLNGYFLRRFDMALSRTAAGILTAGLFCLVHTPNWFLMLVTPVTAIGAIWVYRKYRNLYFLGLAHAVIGFALFMVVPDSVSHHLRVGPGWFTWRPIATRHAPRSGRRPGRDRRLGSPKPDGSRPVWRAASTLAR